jgi:hypothetical protein
MIAENLLKIKSELPENVTLVAVSKTKKAGEIMEAYNAGQRIFGENKVQEIASKFAELPKDIQWHLIGHLQSNKVKYISQFISLVHSVDSFKLLEIIDKEALKNNRIIDCLLQVYIADEETKFGFDKNEITAMLASHEFKQLKNIQVVGLMGMATFTDDYAKVKKEFRGLTDFFNNLKSTYFSSNTYFKELSMGMSNDYQIAIEEGSTLIRVGNKIFGGRNVH